MRKLWAILAPSGFRAETERELAHKKIKAIKQQDDFFLFEGEPALIGWAAVTWLTVEALPIASISDAVKALKPLARRWLHLPLCHRGRASLISEQLREQKFDSVIFPTKLQLPEGLGAFTFLDDDKIVYWCRHFDRAHPRGELQFVEDKGNPPSRAYLKLWEALCLLGEWPLQKQTALDLGSCPGGWTWVLASLNASVLSVDRAPIDAAIEAMPGVRFKIGDAFQVNPANTEPVDWLCSDIICAPEKLLELVKKWLGSGKARRFICTLKFQGEADPKVVHEFQKLGRVLHLHHNKHELTFLK